jgi:hypothetical protein
LWTVFFSLKLSEFWRAHQCTSRLYILRLDSILIFLLFCGSYLFFEMKNLGGSEKFNMQRSCFVKHCILLEQTWKQRI